MKTKIPLAFALIALPLFARTWTDNTGRTMEADFIRADASDMTVMFRGREIQVPLTHLSEQDRQWIKENKDTSSKTAEAPAPGQFTLCGTSIKAGGPPVTVETALSQETLRAFHRRKDVPGKLKITVKLPPAFDPTKPQHVLWVSAPINNDRERKAGNSAAINGYANTAAGEGWMVIAVDTDLGNPRGEDNIKEDGPDQAVHQQAVNTLAAAWPGFKTWKVACGGFSGGAKATFFRVGQMVAANLKVVGVFLGGCNQDMTKDACDEIHFDKTKLQKIRVFISNGKSDPVSTVAQATAVQKSVDTNFGEVQLHLFEGGHGLNQGELKNALTWFSAQ